MLDTLGRYWRVFGTGLSFLTFGIGGLVVQVAVLPPLYLLVWDAGRRQRVAREVIRFAFRSFIWFMNTVGVLRYRCAGLDRLDRRGLLILANHPTLIDTVFLIAFVKHADCVVNAHLFANPYTGAPLRAAGYVRNDAGPALVADSLASLGRGSNLLIFPEGTRTAKDGVIHLKRGAAQVAIRGKHDITPVVITCTPPTLAKGDPWWSVPARRACFTIEVRDDIPVRPFIDQEPALAARRLTAHLEQYLTRESQAHAVA